MKRRALRSRKGIKPAAPQARRTRRAKVTATPRKTKARARKATNSRQARLAGTARALELSPAAAAQLTAPAPNPAPEPVQRPLQIPPILLEGDQPAWRVSEPGPQPPAPEQAVRAPEPAAPAPQPPVRAVEPASLPVAYGTGRLNLLARDPHWLYAYWDLTPEQQRKYNALARDRHLALRIRPGTVAGHEVSDLGVHPESRSWFIHVEGAGKRYSAELGYYPANRRWVPLASSQQVETPADTISRDKTLRFATIPPEAELRQTPVPARLPEIGGPPRPVPAQPAALAEVMQRYLALHRTGASGELAELLRGLATAEIAPSLLPSQVPLVAAAEKISSPLGAAAAAAPGFWLNLNAELVLYGATEPNASLTISGKPVALRPDGTFSFRFALPDGAYELTVSAVSTHGDSREAHLSFVRLTSYAGEVGTASQDPSLKPPAAENL
jgi:uncharacterized protein